MKKIFIIHENNEWVEPLLSHLSDLQAPFETWHMNQVCINTFNDPPIGVFYNRMSASSHTRGHRYAPEYTATVLDWLEYHNRRVINNSRSLNLELSKSLQYKELQREGIKVPNTVFAKDKSQLLELGKSFPLPFLTKHNRAGRGLGIKLFSEYKDFKEYIKSEDFNESIDGITLLQEYIIPKNDIIIRVEFIDSQFLYAVQVDTTKGFELCPADACNLEEEYCPANTTGNKFMILDKFTNPILEQYQNVLKKNYIEIAGIEFIEDQNGKLYTYDINTNTNYNSIAEDLSNLKGMKAIASFLNKELIKIN
jgi:hypothetical protein